MKFVQEIEKLQKENEESIIIAKNGIFFVAIGKDAITLHEQLNLKLTCMKKELCKVGFLVKNVEKYIQKLEEIYKFKGKNYKNEVILFNLKQEEYIRWLYEQLKNGTYKHGGYRIFYIQYPKKRKIEASRYIDRIVHRWIVDSFLNRYFVSQFINTSYACIKNRGMHKASIDVQNAMKHCKKIWQNYYVLKMDIRKYFQNIDKDILMKILKRKVKEEKLFYIN
ncbi:MAG: hypothetical protein UE116_05515 [Clostridia bacterium]|nr:hypothetical protein [Clostridia bacterium]